MKIRAVIFDLYKTLLAVGSPPLDADERWRKLLKPLLRGAHSISLAEFSRRCQNAIAREHATARVCGVSYPEVYWPDIVRRALPGFARLGEARQKDFMFEHAKLLRTVSLAHGAADVLRRLRRAKIPLGLVSNCQPYTLLELDEALRDTRLDSSLFRNSLSFLSFEQGFSKPDPHVFRILVARLAALGITPEEALIVGDRLDNDIEPAKKLGFQTWLLREGNAGENSGGWARLGARLKKFQ